MNAMNRRTIETAHADRKETEQEFEDRKALWNKLCNASGTVQIVQKALFQIIDTEDSSHAGDALRFVHEAIEEAIDYLDDYVKDPNSKRRPRN